MGDKRRIKFRCYQDSVMYSWEQILNRNQEAGLEGIVIDFPMLAFRDQGIHWMQFTGVYDDYENEIYEGDIVTFHKGYVDDSWTDGEQGKPYVITWINEEGYVGFYAVRDNKRLVPTYGRRGKYQWSWNIIGNIHQGMLPFK